LFSTDFLYYPDSAPDNSGLQDHAVVGLQLTGFIPFDMAVQNNLPDLLREQVQILKRTLQQAAGNLPSKELDRF